MKIDDKCACFSVREKKIYQKLHLSVQCLEQPNEFGRHIDTRGFILNRLCLWKFFLFISSPALFASHGVSNNNNHNNKKKYTRVPSRRSSTYGELSCDVS